MQEPFSIRNFFKKDKGNPADPAQGETTLPLAMMQPKSAESSSSTPESLRRPEQSLTVSHLATTEQLLQKAKEMLVAEGVSPENLSVTLETIEKAIEIILKKEKETAEQPITTAIISKMEEALQLLKTLINKTDENTPELTELLEQRLELSQKQMNYRRFMFSIGKLISESDVGQGEDQMIEAYLKQHGFSLLSFQNPGRPPQYAYQGNPTTALMVVESLTGLSRTQYDPNAMTNEQLATKGEVVLKSIIPGLIVTVSDRQKTQQSKNPLFQVQIGLVTDRAVQNDPSPLSNEKMQEIKRLALKDCLHFYHEESRNLAKEAQQKS